MMLPARILIADPDPDIGATIELYLASKAYQVQVLTAIDELIKITRRWQPHAVLVSTAFSNGAAFLACRALLTDTLTAHIPIIMLLHINQRQTRLEALEAGVNDLIAQPFDLEELALRLEAVVRFSTRAGQE